MKNYITNKSMLSLATAVLLMTSGCGDGGSSNDTSSKAVKVVGGVVDLGINSASKSSARKSMARTESAMNPTCGDSASVQLYAIDDTDYATPLLENPAEVNATDCSFDVNDADFIDKSNAGVDKQYIVRTIVKTGDKFVELAATKLSEGADVGKVNPIATMIKERFELVLEEVKTSMDKLSSLGVDETAIKNALNNIVSDFKKNFDTTVANLKEDIKTGKVKVDTTLFETKETLTATGTATDAVKKAREEKANKIKEKLKNSSVQTQFAGLDNSVKRQQLKSVTIDEKTIKKGLTAPLAQIKYNIVESFVKIGLPVHDGRGNLIVFIPIDEDRQGELPGKEYKISYNVVVDGKITKETYGNDFAIRSINPKTDLTKISGKEDWYKDSLEHMDTVVPANVINAMLIAKDHVVTMKTIGQALSKVNTGDTTTDAFVATGLYDLKMSDSVEESVEKIVTKFKAKFIKNNYDMFVWDSIDDIFSSFEGMEDKQKAISSGVEKLKSLPFIATKSTETPEDYMTRLSDDANVTSFLVEEIGASLTSGIPVSADVGMLQFSADSTITADSKLKPLAALSMVNLYMSVNGGDHSNNAQLTQKPLTEMFGWIAKDQTDVQSLLDDKNIWIYDYSQEGSSASQAPKRSSGYGEMTPEERIKQETENVMILVKAITGDKKIRVEKTFKFMMKSLSNVKELMEKKKSNGFGFEDEFKDDMMNYPSVAQIDASISFKIQGDLSPNESLFLVPVFTEQESGAWVSMDSLKVDTTKIGESFMVDNFTLYNPKGYSFDADGKENKNSGLYKSTGMYNLVLFNAEDNSSMPIANFPIFPGQNNLNVPFFYDNEMMDNFMGSNDMMNAHMGDDMENNMPLDVFYEHKYIDAESENNNIFFPQITTKDGYNVGENLFSYDVGTKTLKPTLTNGVVSGASMKITMMSSKYDDTSAPSDITGNIIFDTNISEGAFFQLELSGNKIKTQTINMNIISIGDDGALELELFKSDRFMQEMMKDVFENQADKKPEIAFTLDMIQGKTFFFATKTLDGQEYSTAQATFNSNGTREFIKRSENVSNIAEYSIDDGILNIDNKKIDITMKITGRGEGEGVLYYVDGYNANGKKIFDRLVFESEDKRDAFINSHKPPKKDFTLGMIEGKTFYLATDWKNANKVISKVTFKQNHKRDYQKDGGNVSEADYEITKDGNLHIYGEHVDVTMEIISDGKDKGAILAVVGFNADHKEIFKRLVFDNEDKRNEFVNSHSGD